MLLSCFLLFLGFYKAYGHYDPLEHKNESSEREHVSRRILKGKQVTDTRPYMVYLRPAKSTKQQDPNWLCGGVIIHQRYILTSAACIEDTMHFYIISGTHRWVPPTETNDCIKNGATKAIWKCVPKTYHFDGQAFNNIQWMANDIAVVMTAEPFNFNKRVKGCDFIPQMIKFNNETAEYEEPGRTAAIAGWGSATEYSDATDIIARTSVNSPQLMEADVEITSKESCKAVWLDRYSEIIDEHMICGRNVLFDDLLDCEENQMECRELVFSAEKVANVRRQRGESFDHRILRSLRLAKSLRRARQKSLRREGKEIGGFCENDHGGPLITGQGMTSVVIGVMSAYRTLNNSKRCVGPFLYTSVYNNRNLINCAINRQTGAQCRTVLRESSTVLDQEDIYWGEKTSPSKPRVKKDKDQVRRSKNKTRDSKHPRSLKLVKIPSVVKLSNDSDGQTTSVPSDTETEDTVRYAFLSGGGGARPYYKIRRHAPVRKQRGRARASRRGRARSNRRGSARLNRRERRV